jgi:hypothetical protein
MSHKKASAPLIAPDSRNSINKKALGMYPRASNWVQGLDLNRPHTWKLSREYSRA